MKPTSMKNKNTSNINVGGNIVLTRGYFDGRVTEEFSTSMKITKVNRVTFDVESSSGEILRINKNSSDFTVVMN